MNLTTKRRIRLGTALFFLVATLGFLALPKDPYKCLSTQSWLAMVNVGGLRMEHAAVALRRTPTNELFPILRQWITSTNSSFQTDRFFGLIPALTPQQRRLTAFHTVALLGSNAQSFLPELKEALHEASPSSRDAAFALFAIGPRGHSVLNTVTGGDGEEAKAAKAAAAEMLVQPGVTAALQHWSQLSAEEMHRIRLTFNLKFISARIRMYRAPAEAPSQNSN